MVRFPLISPMNGKGLVIALFLALGAGGGILLQHQKQPQQPAEPANAQESSSCQYVYGGGKTCVQTGKIILNKTIQHPSSSQLVDSLAADDAKFSADQTVTFHLTLTNTNTQVVKNVTVQDTIPQLLTLISGDGQFDQNAKVFSFTVDSLNPGESKTRVLKMKVLSAEQLPKNRDTTCILNQARATYGNGNVSEDNAQFCIQTKILGAETGSGVAGPAVLQPAQQATQTPPTGASDLALLLLLPAGLAGFLLRKRAA